MSEKKKKNRKIKVRVNNYINLQIRVELINRSTEFLTIISLLFSPLTKINLIVSCLVVNVI